MPVTQRESLTELGGINIPIIGYSICDRLDLTVFLILWDNIRYMTCRTNVAKEFGIACKVKKVYIIHIHIYACRIIKGQFKMQIKK